MPDRGKVIKGLECCLDPLKTRCPECPYYPCYDQDTTSEKLLSDALELLKAQEPHLVTKEDFQDADEWGYLPVWCETVEGRVYCECILLTALAIEQGLYRYWTAMPTDEQREAVKWDG